MDNKEKDENIVIPIDKGGINALGGFAFQIKVFLYYAVKLETDEKIQFEVLEDVSIEKEKDLDKYEDAFRTIRYKKSNEVVQVKHTQLDKTKTKKVLLNWILLELDPNYDISKYILFTVPAKKSKNFIDKISARELFDFVTDSDETNLSSKKHQLKKIFEHNFSDFEKIVNGIKGKYEYLDPEQINEAIYDRAKSHLKAGTGITDTTYLLRINALKDQITNNIIESVNQGQPFEINHAELMGLEEDIIQAITDKFPMPNYSEYVRTNKINLNKISNTREIIQLNYCGLTDEDLKTRIHSWMYYSDYRFRLREMNRPLELGDIEQIAHENFKDVKALLLAEENDSPLKRLINTESKVNSYAPVEPIKKGACVYLTKEKFKPEEIQISWKDE